MKKMEIRNDKISFLNNKFRTKYKLRCSPTRIIELYKKSLIIEKIRLITGWKLKDIKFIIDYMEKNLNSFNSLNCLITFAG